MSESPEAATSTTSAEAPTSAPAPAAAPQTPVEPSYILERARRAQASVLKELGVKVRKTDDPKAKLEEYKAREAEKKAERRALREENAALKAEKESLQAAKSVLGVYVETELAALDESSREMVKKLAGDDPVELAKQVTAIKALRASSPAPKPADPAAPAPLPPPAQTAPAATSPTAAPSVPTNERQEYERLGQINPLLAAEFLFRNLYAIYPPSR